MSAEYFEEQRRQLIAAIRANTDQVAAQIGKAALDKRVLGAMAKVPRHEFVPVEAQPYAYLNMPLPIASIRRSRSRSWVSFLLITNKIERVFRHSCVDSQCYQWSRMPMSEKHCWF